MLKRYKIVLILILTVTGFAHFDEALSGDLKKKINIYNGIRVVAQVAAEVADTPQERGRGLMFKESMGEKEGMLFIFQKEGLKGFWMKNTYIPLDIIFINKDFEVASIVKDARPCKDNPCKTYESKYPVKYALEVNAGFANQYGIGNGTRIEILP
jgi:hypothetical protein